jgi:hypothetical protein
MIPSYFYKVLPDQVHVTSLPDATRRLKCRAAHRPGVPELAPGLEKQTPLDPATPSQRGFGFPTHLHQGFGWHE